MKNLIFTLIIGISAAQLVAGEKEKKVVASSSAAMPAALVGQWQSGSVVPTNFYDSSSQQWSEPNGRGIFLIVEANGKYHFGAGEQITSVDYFLYNEGRAAIDDGQIVLSPQLGSEYSRDLCIHAEDQRASSKAELQAAVFNFRVIADQHGTQLVLTNASGESVTLQRRAQ